MITIARNFVRDRLLIAKGVADIEEGWIFWALLANFGQLSVPLHKHAVLASLVPMPKTVISTPLSVADTIGSLQLHRIDQGKIYRT